MADINGYALNRREIIWITCEGMVLLLYFMFQIVYKKTLITLSFTSYWNIQLLQYHKLTKIWTHLYPLHFFDFGKPLPPPTFKTLQQTHHSTPYKTIYFLNL